MLPSHRRWDRRNSHPCQSYGPAVQSLSERKNALQKPVLRKLNQASITQPPAPKGAGNLSLLSYELRIHHLPLRGTQRARDDNLRSLQSIRIRYSRQRPLPLRGSPHPHRNSPGDGNPHPRHRSPTRQSNLALILLVNRPSSQGMGLFIGESEKSFVGVRCLIASS